MKPFSLSKRSVLLAAAAALALAGCSTPREPADPADPRLSVVFGYFDMKQAPSPVEWLSLKSYGSDAHNGYTLPGEKGLFLHVAVEPGAYQVDRFGGMSGVRVGGISFFGSNHQYSYSALGRNDTAIRITRPGAYYLGAYEYVANRRGWLEQDEFEMRPLPAPDERELLLKVQHRFETDSRLQPYTHQLDLVRRRVAELSRLRP